MLLRHPHHSILQRTLLILTGLSLATIFGCGSASHEDFVPDETTAADGLRAALEAWKTGKKHGSLDTADPVIQVVDSKWRSGAKLREYEILEEVPSDGPKKFRVKLTLDKPATPEETFYLVVGKDPLWVYREKDYLTASTSM